MRCQPQRHCMQAAGAVPMQAVSRPELSDTLPVCRAEATDVANAVLDGVDGILLGAETLRGLYPRATVETTLHICKQAEKVFDHREHFDRLMQVHPAA